MSSNRVPACQSARLQTILNQRRGQWIGIIPILVLALGLGGCALNSTGLPGGLPIPPGGGTLTIARSTVVDGIQGRTYTIWIPTTGGSGTLSTCTIIAGGLPAGLSIAISADPPATTAVSFCKITGTITTVGPAPLSFTLQAADSAGTLATQTFSIFVRPDFAVTTATLAPNNIGVVGRTFGNPAAPDLKAPQPVVTSASTTVGNAPVTCLFSGTAITNNPAFITAPPATPVGLTANTCNLSSAAAALTTAGAFSVSLAATDSPIMDPYNIVPFSQVGKVVVPAATKNSVALALSVNPPLTMVLTQSTNATPNAALFNAVSGRTYATGVQAPFAPTYTPAGGLTAAGTYNWCISLGALPAGFAASPSALSACPTTAAIATGSAVTVTSPAAGAASANAFTLQVADVANAAVSSGTATSGTNLAINAVLSLAANFNNPVPDAVFGRTWGAVGTPLVYTASGGFGAYTFTAPPTAGAPVAGSFPAPMACLAAATTLTCSSAAVTGTVGAYTNAPASVDDAGNPAVPGSASVALTATVTRSLTVRAEFTITTITAFLNGVQGRTYGNPAAPDLKTPQPVVTDVSATIGNAPLTLCVFTVLPSNPGFILTPAPTGGNTCSLSSGAAVLTTAGVFTVALAATDSPIIDPVSTGTVVPANTISNSGAPLALTVDPALTLTLTQATNLTPTVALLNAVQGRSYGIIGGTPTYTPAGGLSGTVNYDWCISVGNLPAGFAASPSALSACPTTAAIPTATAVTVTSLAAGAASANAFTIQISDTGNAAVSIGFATQGTTLTINGLLAIAECSVTLTPCAGFGSPLPDAVFGRPYGGAGFTPITYQASAGVGAYTFTAAPTAGAPGVGVFPTPMTCVPAATTLTCSSAAITGTAGAYTNAPTSVDDAGNTAVPGSVAAAATATITQTLNVRAALTFLSVNYANPLPDAVNGRSWGTGGFTPLIYTAQGGLGGYSFAISGTAFPTGIACATAAATFTCDTTIAGTVTGAAGSYLGILVNVNDTANATTPSASALPNTQPPAVSRDITVDVPLAVALQAGSPDPTTVAGQAVVGRTYGAPAATDVVYVVTGGLPAALPPLYTITSSGTLTTNTNIACTAGSTTATCNSANVVVSNTGGLNPSLTISATDTANLATPSGAASKTDVWTVNPAITFSLAPAPTGVAPNGIIPDGVVGQPYGTPLADLVFTATGGLANAAGIGLTGTQTGTLIANNITCVPTTAQVGVTVTVTCNSAAGAGLVTGPSGAARTLIMTFSDVGNSTTPAGSTNTDTAGFTNYSNTIADALAIALQALSPDPANVNAQAVVGLPYGMAPQAPVVYVATGGLPAYTFVRSGTLLVNSNICGVQNVTATTLTCDSNGGLVTGTTGVLTVTVNGTGNATTPATSAFLTKTYTVNAALSMTVAPDPADTTVGGTGTVAVIGRGYGTLAVPAMLSPTYTASGGLSIYTYTLSNPPGAGITCTSGLIPASVCSSALVTAAAPVSFDVTVTDGGNLTTPANAVGVTLTRTFTVNAALSISTASLKNGLVNYTYVPTGPGVTLAATGGLGGNTWVAGGAVGACAPTGSLPTGLSLGAATGLLSGIPTVISALPTDFTFDVCVFDTVNATTPSGTDTHANYVINVLDTLAAAANSGNDSLAVFNTTSNATPATNIALTALDAPFGVAVTPDGTKAYVTAFGNNAVRVVNTITGLVTNITGGLGACTGPQGIAIGMPGGVPTAFVACSNRRIAVINASTDTFISASNYGTVGANFYGVAITPNDALVYVTDAANDELVVLNAATATEIALSPFTLPGTVTVPHGVLVSADGNRVYIAGSTSDNVVVLSTADNTTIVAGPISTGAGSGPEALALTPSDAPVAHVFVTLTGTDAFAVINDSLATPAIIGAPIVTAGSVPFGVTIPPLLVVPGTGVRVYIAQFGPDSIAIRSDETVTPFGVAAPPIAISGATPNPIGLAHIPVPR